MFIAVLETEAIANCRASVGILLDETIVGQHPWVDDSQQEMERLKKQKEKAQKEFEAQQGYNPFAQKEKGGMNEE
ncbi:MAG: phage portal protein [Ruminiclostridium sp.]|nr:phage portal protein [Ruminiclostridium sp.]